MRRMVVLLSVMALMSVVAAGVAWAVVQRGTNHRDILNGTNGHDEQYGLEGNDTLNGKGGYDIQYGGKGSDTLNGGGSVDAQFAGVGNDTLRGGPGSPNGMHAGQGDDLLLGGLAFDRLTGDPGDDKAFGREGDDAIFGAQGADRLFGESGNDLINGDSEYRGSSARPDILRGGDGNDRLYAHDDIAGNDTLDGGSEVPNPAIQEPGDFCAVDRDTAPDPDVTDHYTDCEEVTFRDVP